jgi:hypothetical protein
MTFCMKIDDTYTYKFYMERFVTLAITKMSVVQNFEVMSDMLCSFLEVCSSLNEILSNVI